MADSKMDALPSDDEIRTSGSLPIGRVLAGRWRICKWLGAGGMGSVYEAEHRNGNRVAIKVLHPHLGSNPKFRKLFLREGYVANRVAHPDAVRVLDDGETEAGDVFLVMDLLEGETLERRRRRAPFTVREVLGITERVLDVLIVAHAGGVIHRDLKPSNIFLAARDGAIKVLDFGIASLRDASTSSMFSSSLLGSAGTPTFMAPEQARGARNLIDERTDLWALGATMFTLLTGRLVHDRESSNATLIAAATTPARLVGSYCPSLPTPVAEIVDCALSFEQRGRWSSATSMQAAVRRALRSCSPGALASISPSGVPSLEEELSTVQSALPSDAYARPLHPSAVLAPVGWRLAARIVASEWRWVAVAALIAVASGAVLSRSRPRPVRDLSTFVGAEPDARHLQSDELFSAPNGASLVGNGVREESATDAFANRTESASAPPPSASSAMNPSTPSAHSAESVKGGTSRRRAPDRARSGALDTDSKTPPLPTEQSSWSPNDSWLDRRK